MSNKDNFKVIQENDYSFTQIFNCVLDMIKDPYELSLYVNLSRYRNNSTGVAFPSYETLMGRCGFKKPKLIKCVKSLESKGIIEVARSKHKPNIYTLKHPVNIPKIGVTHDYTSENRGNSHDTRGNPHDTLGVTEGYSNYTKVNYTNKELDNKGAKALTPQITQSDIILNEPKITKLDILKKELSILEDYPKQDRLDFYAYWTEVDSFAKKKVMRFEKAKPFNVKRRLATWMGKKANWQNPAQMKTERDEFKMKATMGMTLHQKVQWEYDNKFITREQLESMNIKGIDL